MLWINKRIRLEELDCINKKISKFFIRKKNIILIKSYKYFYYTFSCLIYESRNEPIFKFKIYSFILDCRISALILLQLFNN